MNSVLPVSVSLILLMVCESATEPCVESDHLALPIPPVYCLAGLLVAAVSGLLVVLLLFSMPISCFLSCGPVPCLGCDTRCIRDWVV